jgi:outer membrane protein TolC
MRHISSSSARIPAALAFGTLLAAAALPSRMSGAPAPAAASAPTMSASKPAVAWPSTPLSLQDALEKALQQSPAILKGKQDIEESLGVAVQLRAAALPRLTAGGAVNSLDGGRIESVPFAGTPGLKFQSDKNWNTTIQVTQPIYAGGKIASSLRSMKWTREAALANYQALVEETLLNVRIAYDDVLLAAELIKTQEASVHLLEQELTDARRRYEAGTVPRFNVLRAEVELANAKPRLIRARNSHRIAKNTLATQLGWNIPNDGVEDIPLQLSGKLETRAADVSLIQAIGRALANRPELTALRAQESLRNEDIVQAKAGRLPVVSVGGGWGWQSRTFVEDFSSYVDGWTVGARVDWAIWDGGLTRGNIDAAKARRQKARIETDDISRKIELEVRTAHSSFREAREVLESQAKVIEQAEEALRLANARAEAGSGTQLEVLSAQTALTESRSTYAQGSRDDAVAWARLERAMGAATQLRADK